MDMLWVILLRCYFSNIGLCYLFFNMFKKEEIFFFYNQYYLYDWVKGMKKESFFILYLVFFDFIYSNIIYFQWFILLKQKINFYVIEEIIIVYYLDIFLEFFVCICLYYKYCFVNINNLINDEIVRKMYIQCYFSKSGIVKKYIELMYMEFCVLKLMILGYMIDDISILYNIKFKIIYIYSNSIMK